MPSAQPPAVDAAPGAVAPTPPCLNCGASLSGVFCAQCGQERVDLAAPTWHVCREAFADVTDVDGRAVRTVRAMRAPGLLTMEYLRGRRAPYLSPLKLFLIVGALLSATWALTRGVDARYYGLTDSQSASAYIETVVRGLLAASLAIAVSSWLLSLGRRRFLDEAVFALHTGAAVSLWLTVVIWLATAWKWSWGTEADVPDQIPSIVYLLFLPGGVGTFLYVAASIRRIHGVAWWAAVLRTLVFGVVTIGTVTLAMRVLFLRG